MSNLELAKPNFGAYRADPFTVSEIDAHPDCDRIWATVKALQDSRDKAIEDAIEEQCGIVSEAEEIAADEADREAREHVLRLANKDSATEALNAILEWAND